MTVEHASPAASGARYVLRLALPLCAAALVLAAGCARRDSITVGSVPDDYRTNHPIVIAEKEQNLDLPVGASDRGMT
ncbi:pilus assembly protein CpaD, partial [Rhizobiaceae sp. 2RAB30]